MPRPRKCRKVCQMPEIRKFTEKSVIIKITAPYKNCADIKGADDEYIVVNFFKI